ncbi:MAG TPA: CARDB domain-containing protein [Methylomirabilota bacterium]|nr:CARDB domain-containing protein [Methylomirabilota bacterium]
MGNQLGGVAITPGIVRDLTVACADISVSNPRPGVGDTVLVKALLRNVGKAEATNVEAVLTAGAEEIARQTFASIPVGGQVLLSGLLNVKSEGVLPLTVTIDPANLVPETNESNNVATHPLVVGPEPPNMIQLTAALSKNPVRPGEMLTLTGQATYNPLLFGSALPVAGGEVTVFIPGQNWLETVRIRDDGSFTVEMMGAFAAGEYSVVVVVNACGVTATINLPLTVDPPVPGVPDLTVRLESILFHGVLDIFTVPQILDGSSLTSTIFVFNVGGADVTTPFEVRFFDVFEGVATQICGLAGQPACPVVNSVAAGAAASVDFTHAFTGVGFHILRIAVDPTNVVAEADESNNIAGRGLIVVSNLPDATPVDILVSDPTPVAGSLVTITAAIQNNGNTTSAPVTVTFLDNGGTIGSSTLSGLPGFAAVTTTSVVHSFVTAGPHTIRVEVDPANSVAEQNETNNVLELTILVRPPAPDLIVTNLAVSPDPAVAGDLTVSANVLNGGELDASASILAISFDGVPVGTIAIPALTTGAQVSVTHAIAGVAAGTRTVTLEADATAAVAEGNESNNTATRTFTVFPVPPPDLEITANDLTVSTQNPQVNESVTVSVRVRNRGTGESATTGLTLRVDGQVVATATIPALAVGGDTLIPFTIASSRAGLVLVEAEADPGNLIVEVSEVNNKASKALAVGPSADLAIAAADISFSNNSPIDGENVIISARIHNLGAQDALGVFLDIYDGDPTTGRLIGRAGPVDVLICLDPTVFCPEPTLSVTFNTRGKPGPHEIVIVVDPDNTVPESNETNNRASRFLTVTYNSSIEPIINAVIGLNLPARVPGGKGIENSLLVKLNAAVNLANAGDNDGAIGKLEDFIAEVQAKTQPPASKPLTPAEADGLIQLAQDLIQQLGGTP